MLICYAELPVILVPVGQGKVDDVIARGHDEELEAVGRGKRHEVHVRSRSRGDFTGHLTEVLGKDNGQGVAIDGCLDGGTFGNALNATCINSDMAIAVKRKEMRGSATNV